MTYYSQLNKFDFYRSYHQNPYNKMIHFICIPMLSICFLNIANIIKSDKFLLCIYCYYYFSFGLKIGLIMTNYLILLYNLAIFWRTKDVSWRENTLCLFIFSWIFQFFGHFIEGNRPALLTGITQAFLEAPLFTVEYIYPALLNSF